MRTLLAASAISLLLGALAAWLLLRGAPSDDAPVQEIVSLVDSREIQLAGGVYAIAISPDGRSVIFSGRGPLGHRLYLRRLGSRDLEPLESTEDGRNPVFSPDGRWVGFTANGKLYKMELGQGRPTMLADIGNARGATWSPSGTITVGTVGDGLFQVDSESGELERFTPNGDWEGRRLQSPESAGDSGLFFSSVGVAGDDTAIVAYPFASGQPHEIGEGTTPRYAAGHLFFARGSDLYGVGVDPESLLPTEAPRLLLEGVRLSRNRYSQYAVAEDGSVTFFAAGAENEYELLLLDRQGREERLPLQAGTSWLAPRVSNDGTRIASSVRFGATGNGEVSRGIWIYDLERGSHSRLTFENATDLTPVWTADGRDLVFASVRDDRGFRLWRKAADGTGSLTEIGAESPNGTGYAVSPQGHVVYTRVGRGTSVDLHVWKEGETPADRPLVTGPDFDAFPEISPDGRWLLHSSGPRLWVRPFPDVEAATWELPLENRGGRHAGAARRRVEPWNGRDLRSRRQSDVVLRVLREGRPLRLRAGSEAVRAGACRRNRIPPVGRATRRATIRRSAPSFPARSGSIAPSDRGGGIVADRPGPRTAAASEPLTSDSTCGGNFRGSFQRAETAASVLPDESVRRSG